MIKRIFRIFRRRQYITQEQKKLVEVDLKKELENKITLFKNSLPKVRLNISKPKLSEEQFKAILEALEKFEKSKKYLSQNINLNVLASELGTNSKYLSRTININKQKNFTQYINDLRIEYLIELLKIDVSYTKYSIKAIAEEIGFKTARAFSTAFHKNTGKYPSEYIKQISI